MRSPWLIELRQLLKLAAPLAAAHAGSQLMSLVDTAIVGRLGAVELGAVGLANGLFFFFSVIGMGTMMGLDPLVSQALGAGDRRRARHLLWQGAWLSLLVGAALALPIFFAPFLLVPFGIEAEVAEKARDYAWVRILGLVPALLFVSVRSYLQALGLTRPMIVAMVAANVLNLGATLLLVFGGAGLPAWTGPLRSLPALGVVGAAIATSLCFVLQAAIVAWAVRGVEAPALTPGERRFDKHAVRKAFKVGLPIGLQMGAEVGVFALVGMLVGKLGNVELAAHQVALTLASFSFTVSLGIGAAGSVRVGRAVGAGDAVGTRRAGITAVLGSASFMAIWAAIFLAVPGPLAALLTDDPAVIAAAIPLLGVAAVFQVSDGVQAVGAGILRGAGDTRIPFLANVVGHYVVGLPIGIGLGLVMGLGVNGLWWGLCAGLTAVAATLVGRFVRLSSRPIRPLVEAPERDPAPVA